MGALLLVACGVAEAPGRTTEQPEAIIGSSALLVIDPWVELIPVGRTFESARAAMPSGIWG